VDIAADTGDCGYVDASVHQTVAVTAAYVVIAICGICLVILFIRYLHRRFAARTCCRRQDSHSDDSTLLDISQRRWRSHSVPVT